MQSFEPYRQMLQSSMRHAGAIRLDHVLGLKRLYLVPHGFGADNGVYVQMPFEALLAATAQESVAHRCVVIGEDLDIESSEAGTAIEAVVGSCGIVGSHREAAGSPLGIGAE
jgi:4-alpha-glucanotransferase